MGEIETYKNFEEMYRARNGKLPRITPKKVEKKTAKKKSEKKSEEEVKE